MANTPSNPQDITILVVDDDWLNQELMEGIFMTVGYRVIQETNGLKALAVAQNTQPNLIILDVRLPKISGFEICNRLKNTPNTRHIPVILVSGHALSEIKERAQQVGADIALERIVSTDELLSQVAKLLKT